MDQPDILPGMYPFAGDIYDLADLQMSEVPSDLHAAFERSAAENGIALIRGRWSN